MTMVLCTLLYCKLIKKKNSYFENKFWNVKPKYYFQTKNNIVFFYFEMYKLLVLLFILVSMTFDVNQKRIYHPVKYLSWSFW